MKNKLCLMLVFCLVLAMILSFLVSCKASEGEAAQFPIEVTDQIGRVVKFEKVPERIVSLCPSNTEILFALGLGDKVVGVDDYSNYPEEAEEKPKVGGYSTSDIERIVALEPDLVLIEDIHTDEILPALENLGLTVFTADPRSLDEILESFTLVGKITGKDKEAARLVADLTNRINAITDKTDRLSEAQRPKVFYILWHDPLMTVGTDTWHHELIELAGGRNIIQDTEGFPTLSLEALIEANPQVIITSAMGEGTNLPFQFASTEPRLASIDARINNCVYEINSDLIDRPGPRIVDALEQFAEFIHPELFK